MSNAYARLSGTTPELRGPSPALLQEYYLSGERVIRKVVAGRHVAETYLPIGECGDLEHGISKAWNLSVLKGAVPQPLSAPNSTLRIVDLFAGGGGFSAGLSHAARAAGLRAQIAACVDLDPVGLDVIATNLKPRRRLKRNVDALVDYAPRHEKGTTKFAYRPELLDPSLQDIVGNVDIVVGGPPCQGHSNLNNHTRRDDLRNSLYLTVPAIGIALSSPVIIIENVQAVLRDKRGVVDKARSILESEYHVQDAVLEASQFGVPQTRKRHFLIATKNPTLSIEELREHLHLPGLSVQDAIGDLAKTRGPTLFDMPAELSVANRQRVEFLFDEDKYNLPNEERPDCHKEGHTYPSVYGRLYPDQPSGTITTGFLSPGRGRYVHPTERRGLTPHEGARLQGFPDSYDFVRESGEKLSNKDYTKLIGDAVPPPLGYAIGLAAIASL